MGLLVSGGGEGWRPPGEVQDEVVASPAQVQEMLDWAAAAFAGKVLADDQAQPQVLEAGQPPFSFGYGGKDWAELRAGWQHAAQTTDHADRVEHRASWTDPQTGLCVSAVATAYKRCPAVDWVLYFENRGQQDTPIIQDIQALEVGVRTGDVQRPALLHRLEGDSCGERSFLPLETPLGPGQRVAMAPTGGRPSSISAFPWWNLEYAGQGVMAAIGWTGQWAASFQRPEAGPIRMRAGMEHTHLRLQPGERIRSPRILLMTWQGDRLAAHNRWRRLLLLHYVPQEGGRPVRLPVVSQCFDRYVWSVPEWATEAGQIRGVEFARQVGCDAYWLDAAWFVGGFPDGAGNWYCKPQEFPHGLKPVADACHAAGMKFVVWFEPERVAAGSEIAQEHPEFVFGGEQGGLFKLNDPAARRWLLELLSRRIRNFGIDIYRNDFNIDPLDFWRDNDAPDRQGMTEISYVAGLYELWDELRARHPGLVIDNCASGGRRIDLEMCMRSVPLWRSDTGCSPGHPDWNQAQSCGLSLFVPLHTACGWTPAPYDFRSSATGGAICEWAYLDPDFPLELAQATLAEAKENQQYWYGDCYPLHICTVTPDHWAAYQLHRPDLGAGLVLAFRREQCRYPVLALQLRALQPAAAYALELIDDAGRKTTRRVRAEELMAGWELRLPRPGSSMVIRYRELQQRACRGGTEPRL